VQPRVGIINRRCYKKRFRIFHVAGANALQSLKCEV
jgi:hypothetical protein